MPWGIVLPESPIWQDVLSTETSFSAVQPLNASTPISFKVDGSETIVRRVQFSNALFSILTTEFGMVTLSRLLQPANA
ncbi:MAG: hypothetical protein IJU56_05155 [Clostridia bacterium]|nr:hypothetical protein [Clostridia bacterium]